MVNIMEIERKANLKSSSPKPCDIKENNFNSLNIFDTSFKSTKSNVNGFKLVKKLKRNFK